MFRQRPLAHNANLGNTWIRVRGPRAIRVQQGRFRRLLGLATAALALHAGLAISRKSREQTRMPPAECVCLALPAILVPLNASPALLDSLPTLSMALAQPARSTVHRRRISRVWISACAAPGIILDTTPRLMAGKRRTNVDPTGSYTRFTLLIRSRRGYGCWFQLR